MAEVWTAQVAKAESAESRAIMVMMLTVQEAEYLRVYLICSICQIQRASYEFA